MEWNGIEYNPVSYIKRLPTTESNFYQPLTVKEKEILREYLFLHHYRYFVFTMLIYQTGIHPKEILALKIKDCDLVNQEIVIVPDEKLQNSKTKKIRRVPLNRHIISSLRELALEECPKDYFLFGSTPEGYKNNKIIEAYHPDYFKPSPIPIKTSIVTKFWAQTVREKLQINKHLYALKHTGANNKILAGIDLDALR